MTARSLLMAAGLLFTTAAQAEMTLAPLSGDQSPAPLRFTRLEPAVTGVAHRSVIDPAHPLARLYASAMAMGGVAAGDCTGDGRADLFFSGASGASRLYVQTGEGFHFQELAAPFAVKNAWDTGAVFVDADGDGKLDLFVARYESPCALFMNKGTGKDGLPVFADEAAARGVALTDAAHSPVFFDYDRDGDLDLYLVTNRLYREHEVTAEEIVAAGADGKLAVRPEMQRYYAIYSETHKADGKTTFEAGPKGRPDYLLRNDGKGNFTDVTAAAGITGDSRGLSATVWDYDLDGWPDLYVANDFEDYDRLYRNNHDGTFTNRIRETAPVTPWFAMGADTADFDGDGLLDLFVADMSGTTHFKQKMSMGSMSAKSDFLGRSDPRQAMRNMLFLNTRAGRFREAAFLCHLDSTDWTWAVQAQDFDRDGRADLYVTNGMTRNFNEPDDPAVLAPKPGQTLWERHAHLPALNEQNLAFRNDGELHFTDVSREWGLADVGVSMAAAAVDIDSDGRLDLVTVDADRTPGIYRAAGGGRALVITLRQPGANAAAVGARVTMKAGSLTTVRELSLLHGYLGGQPAELHFGLGSAAQADSIQVQWPDGTVESFGPVPAGHRAVLTRSAAAAAPAPEAAVPALFQPALNAPPLSQIEEPFDDFAIQPLLPNKNSQWGPPLAWAGSEADGADRFYLGGPHTRRGQMWSVKGQLWKFGRWSGAQLQEELGAASFDANGDGRLDLYTASGSSEFPPGDPALAHVLYLAAEDGTSAPAPAGFCPEFRDASGALAAADYDGDGRVDLFVGGRLVPGAWPASPVSHLLRNTEKGLVEIPVPGLERPGMVTSALWADLNGDRFPELLLALEWGPVKVFANRAGKLTDATAAWGHADRNGWWNSLAAADVDGDGDLDIFAGNYGLNTKYHTSPEHPVSLYYGDLDGSGRPQLVEAKYEGDKLLPVRGRSCSSAAMPGLREKFTTFRAFASSSLTDIYSNDRLQKAEKFHVSELQSGIFLNEGKRFRFVPLPRQAQLAPVFGCTFLDADADGRQDLLLAQNFWSPQLETGRMDGDLGLLLAGQGDGTFRPLPPHVSGIVVPGDAKALVTTDWNGDAAPDAIFTRNNARAVILTGGPAPSGHQRLTLRLTGPAKNPAATGTRVTVTAGGTTRTAVLCGGGGYLSQSAPVLFFGLGKATAADVLVTWPDGRTTPLPALAAGLHSVQYPAP